MKRFLCQIVFFLFVFYTAPAYAALVSGATASGSIAAGGTSPQSFTGTAGQGVVLYANAAYNVNININKPDGTFWAGGINRFIGTLPASGGYTVTISGYYPTDSGSYGLAYVRGSDSVSGGGLTSGASASGTLTTNGVSSYQFTGSS
jgi:hypothetical protein